MAKEKITLEDLLALKRTEHPTDEQWSKFDERLKDRLVKQIVHQPTILEKIFERVSPVRIFAMGAASFALAAAIFAPIYVSSISGDFGAVAAANGELRVSSTPLPSVAASYAVKEFPQATSSESPVFAQMSANDGGIRYVSSPLSNSAFGSF